MEKILALIPARGGSKRIPEKNLVTIGGMSLVEWSMCCATTLKQIGAIHHIVLSSDDDKILDRADAFDSVHKHRRSVDAASDSATDFHVIADMLEGMPYQPDLIVYLRPTTPFRKASDVEIAINMIKSCPDATGLRSVHKMSESAYKCFELGIGNILKPMGKTYTFNVDACNQPNQEYPPTYHPNGVVDIMRVDQINEGNTFGSMCLAHVTHPTIEIDSEWDLEMAEVYHQLKLGRPAVIFKGA
jgi:N-acylneuraminate cytidylyltransferase